MLASLEIDLDAIRANVGQLQTLVAPARVAPVLKSDAYGHGMVEVARALEGLVERFCVYRAGEAVALREAGIVTPMLVLGPVAPADLALVHASDAALPLWDTGTYARMVERAARRSGAPFKVHAKIDTGLTRLGMPPALAAAAIEGFCKTPELRVEAVFSHLASAEELDSDYTQRQLEALLGATRSLGLPRHIAASAAAMLWPQTRLEMVRAGIAIYGLWPSPQTRRAMPVNGFTLRPALRMRSQLVVVREVAVGQAVGYGCTYRPARPSKIGIIPVGYAEGIPRLAGNRGAVVIDGKRASIVGRVCMNMTFVDVTDVAGAHPGTEVTLIGDDGSARVTADDWAEWSETINYEIVARLPRDLPRRYLGRA